jgi:hypothetical protein
MFPIHFFNNKTCNWSIGFLQIVNISKLYHILGSNHSTFYVWSFQVSFQYKFLVLTPKWPIVPTGDKPVLGSITWSHTIFRFFEDFCPNASWNRLHVSTNFMILGAMDQKLWMFEVFGWSSGNQKTLYFLTFLGWIFFYVDS